MTGPRPSSEEGFRMLCRHNKLVLDYGKIRDPMRVAKRERLWLKFLQSVQEGSGKRPGTIESKQFNELFRSSEFKTKLESC